MTSNEFGVGKAKDNAKKGTATLAAEVSGAGTLKLSGKGVKTTTARATRAGTVNLTIKPIGETKTALTMTGKAKVTVIVTFTPVGGSAIGKLVKVALKLQRH